MELSDPGPRQIGRYLIVGRLGAGGMGEVFLAWDEQLKRNVAIKRIRQDAGLSFQQRERFFCEAQQTASVSHPHVVHIFDLLCEEEAIVMEYIEGRTLAERLAAERLETAQVLRLALEIARGLAAAHEAGLVHRDLKAANVLITRAEEHAKIVDFGLARPVVREPGDPGLTRQGMVMGTPHAMSPEQIQGEVVDQRSDLFSFGSLFHEMLTGRPPFRGTDEFDSQWKVLHEEAVHPLTVRKDLPVQAADLLLRLLEKDRNHRPGSAHEVIKVLESLQIAASASPRVAMERSLSVHPSSEETILELPERLRPDRTPASPAGSPPLQTRHRLLWTGAAVLLLLAAVAAIFLMFRPARPLRIAVILKPHAEDPELSYAAKTIQSAALSALTSLEKITPIDPEEVIRVDGTPAQIGKAVSADQLLTIFVERENGMGLVTLKRTAMQGNAVLRSPPPFNVALSWESRPDLVRTVTDQVQAAYSKGGHIHAEDMEDYASILEIQERVDAGQALPKDLTRLKEIMISRPKLLEAPLLAARIADGQYQERREPADLMIASELAQKARILSPEDRRPLRLQLQIALTRHRTGDAEEILEDLKQLDPSDPGILPLQADLAEQQGHLEEASEALTEAVEQVPSWQNRYLLAAFAARHGRIEVAREQIESILKQSPGNAWALEKSGHLELTYGSLDKAEKIYQRLVGVAPERALNNLGTVRVLRSHFPEAAEIYRKALEAQPNHVSTLINLAEVETELKDESGAAAHYHRALDLLNKSEGRAGLLPVEALLKAQCLARLGRAREAVAIVAALRHKAADDPQLLCQSALVLNLAGERAAALVEARAALAGGISTRWFSGSNLQWLRESPELRPWFSKTSSSGA